jgi:hypothetical protein
MPFETSGSLIRKIFVVSALQASIVLLVALALVVATFFVRDHRVIQWMFSIVGFVVGFETAAIYYTRRILGRAPRMGH